MNPIQFLEAVQARVEWIRENTPELLERNVLIINDDGSSFAKDVRVEEFLVIEADVIPE